MKKNLYTALFAVASLLGVTMAKAQFNYMGSYGPSGVPNYLENPGDAVSPAFLNRVNVSLPEYYPVPVYNPQYLANTTTDIKLLQACDIWITFIGEGASITNSLAYYTYNLSSPPATPPAASAINIIFPNCSLPGYGGDLAIGSKVHLGTFPANTGIGFVCITDGWNGSAVDSGNYLLFSTPTFNPETDTTLRQHNVLLYDSASQKFVLGFEDIRRDQGSDNDFNDILFYITGNPPGAIDTTGIPHTTDPGDTASSGGSGGLESESLCGLVSQRDYNRIKHSISAKVDYSKTPLLSAYALTRNTGTATLEGLLPKTLEAGDEAHVTSPTDLLTLTGAVNVFSVDYTRNNKAKAVALGITTLGKPYNHTKSICDRFRGASLLGVDEITIKGIRCIRYILRRDDGDLEYAIAFAANTKTGSDTYNIQTEWLLSNYQSNDSVYNFQVWATQPHYAVKLAMDILNNLAASKKLSQVNPSFALPKAYIINGSRVKENLVVTLNNNTNISSAKIVFEERVNEHAATTIREVPLTLAAGNGNSVQIPIKDGYEYSGTLYLNGEKVDEVYFADGNWGLDYDGKYTSITQFKPNNNPDRVYADNEFPVYRSMTLQATSSDYISVYKSIRSGFEKANLSEFRSLKFFAKGSGSMTVTLVREGIVKWTDQYRTTLSLDEKGKDYAISFDDFLSATSATGINTRDITSVVFTVTMPGGITKEVSLFIDKMAFSKESVLSQRALASKAIRIFPNPSNGSFQCSFMSDQDRTVQVRATDITGRTVYTQEVNAVTGYNTATVTIPAAPAHALLFITIEADKLKYETGRVLIK